MTNTSSVISAEQIFKETNSTSNIYVVVGKNGTGKTHLLNKISDIAEKTKGKGESQSLFIHKDIDYMQIMNSIPLESKIDATFKIIDDSHNSHGSVRITRKTKYKKMQINSELRRHLSKMINDVNLKFRDGGASFDYLGDGFYSLSKYLLIEEFLAGKKLMWNIIIDEPENHLHSAFIKTFAEIVLKLSRKHKVIISTHSKLLLSILFEKNKEINIVTSSRNGTNFEYRLIKFNEVLSDVKNHLNKHNFFKHCQSMFSGGKAKKGKVGLISLFDFEKRIDARFEEIFLRTIIALMYENKILIGEGEAEHKIAKSLDFEPLVLFSGKPFMLLSMLIIERIKNVFSGEFIVIHEEDNNKDDDHILMNKMIDLSLKKLKKLSIVKVLKCPKTIEDKINLGNDKKAWGIMDVVEPVKFKKLLNEIKRQKAI